MEAAGKDCEEETLQTAFKKLRVDAESVPAPTSASETSRTPPRSSLDTGTKPKLGCLKENWHGVRKTSRGSSRTQRRRRSKSPILQPSKFTYCSSVSAASLSPPSVCLKHSPVEPVGGSSGLAQKEFLASCSSRHTSTVFGSAAAAYESRITSSPSVQDVAGNRESGSETEDGSDCRVHKTPDRTDFRALSELHSSATEEPSCSICSCSEKSGQEGAAAVTRESECSCQVGRSGWREVAVYSFTGLRSVISECEQNLDKSPRTLGASTPPSLASGSPRSCSEQARAYVDDITIEDLSGYMEYYLYIPKKMSHMAEMMYT
ncbi:oxidative stress-responsive serine-rich protein 1 [Synchiropus picturatus]